MNWSKGSSWLRWDPHMHCPGTVVNDQFRGDWDGFCKTINNTKPDVAAIGVTDYFSLEGYQEVKKRQAQGEIRSDIFLFPNIELRAILTTKKNHAVNIHLLINPSDTDHIEQTKLLLREFSIELNGQPYRCTREDFIRLGRTYKGDKFYDEEASLREGTKQFKVEFKQIQQIRTKSDWAKHNVLIAVAGGDDGISGLASDGNFGAFRKELEMLADIVFTSNSKSRDYYHTSQPPKLCLHGSDAHKTAEVLRPNGDRLCWIKASPTFEGLRLAMSEPLRRSHIGPTPPTSATPSNTIQSITINNAPWLKQTTLQLNPGLVSVIGPKGSGKTALADLLALGANAYTIAPTASSFIKKAERHIKDIKITVLWGNNQATTYERQSASTQNRPQPDRAKYLSQQFVEQLCSSTDNEADLLTEIEEVIFRSIPIDERMQANSFSELRSIQTSEILEQQRAQQRAISDLTHQIYVLNRAREALASEQQKLSNLKSEKGRTETDIKDISAASNIELVNLHQTLSTNLHAIETNLAKYKSLHASLSRLSRSLHHERDAAKQAAASRSRQYPDLLQSAILDDSDWESLTLELPSRVDRLLAERSKYIENVLERLEMHGSIAPDADRSLTGSKSLTQLRTDIAEINNKLGQDKKNATRRSELQSKLADIEKKIATQTAIIKTIEDSKDEIKVLSDSRLSAYAAIFRGFDDLSDILKNLYSHLRKSLPEGSKLSVSIERMVDIDAWAARGEELLDLRTRPFAEVGSLREYTEAHLREPWLSGTAKDAVEAIEAFIRLENSANHHSVKEVGRLSGGNNSQGSRRLSDSLSKKFTPEDLGRWIFSTDHISVQYRLMWDGTPLFELSPGTRGVVLLTLYLQIDQWDERPLIIDQPEENLDPRSVFNDLVPFFQSVSERRQVIVVTHNANLVVNADADQVIIADSTRRDKKSLPDISYKSGGLDDPHIREEVCTILEGGAEAFRKRSSRYRLPTVGPSK